MQQILSRVLRLIFRYGIRLLKEITPFIFLLMIPLAITLMIRFTLCNSIKILPRPRILILSSNNTAYQLAPWVNVEFSDQMGASDGNLSAAYFKIDSYVPAGTSLAGWTTIFSNVNYYQNQTGFQFPASVWNPLSDDNHTMWFKVFDHAGNIFESNTTSWIFIKDTTPPTVTVNTTQIYYNADPTITATFNDMTSLNWSYYSVYNGSFNSAWIPIFYNITINYNISTILLKFRHFGALFLMASIP